MRAIVFIVCLGVSSGLRVFKNGNDLEHKSSSAPDRVACGVVLGAFTANKYVEAQYKYAQQIALYDLPDAWCPEDPSMKKVPIIIYSDVPGAADVAQRLSDTRTKDQIRIIDLGTLAEPKPPFTKPSRGILGGTTTFYKHQPFWWWRPQMYMNSPFDIVLTVDDDAMVCSGPGMAGLFSMLQTKKLDYTASQWRGHSGLFNFGFMLFNRTAVKPWLEEWKLTMDGAVASCSKFDGDQGSGNMAWKKFKGQIRTATCAADVCCRGSTTSGARCHKETCLVHHVRYDKYKQFVKEESTEEGEGAAPGPGNKCR